jgi:hypothetical protein
MGRLSPLLALALPLLPAPATAAITIEHDAVACVVADRYPQLLARIAPASDVSRARLYFRAAGSSAWYYVEMQPGAAGFLGTLPKPKRSLNRLEYYFEATGADFSTGRTTDYAPPVVAETSECPRDRQPATALTSAVVIVRGPVGAPAIPFGFSGVGVVSSAGAAAAAAAAGGVSTGLLLAGVGGAAAVAGGVALAAGGDGDGGGAPQPAAAPVPCPPLDVYEIDLRCDAIRQDARVGCPITFQAGIGRWPTTAEAEAALAGRTATITVDGSPLNPVSYVGITLHTGAGLPPGYGNQARATWTATAGAHVVVGRWSGDSEPVSCSFTVTQ